MVEVAAHLQEEPTINWVSLSVQGVGFRCCGTRSRSKIASSGTCLTRRNTRLERERKENRGNRNNRNNRNNREKSREISKLDGVKYRIR